MKILSILVVFGLVTIPLPAQVQQRPAPLFNNLGNHHHPITTQSPQAQRYFDQGMILLFNFNHEEAARSFEAVAFHDPKCAMAWWGVAYALGPNINLPMLEPNVSKAWDALQKAVALRPNGSARERAYIDALAKRYEAKPPKDRAPLDLAYADAMRKVARDYPNDLDAQVLLAEALMDTSPWNYWLPDKTPKPNAREALDAIESVLSRSAMHPGADHLYIHLVEAGPHPERGIPSADRLGSFAPGAGHLVHMPSHIYSRVGRYHDATIANEKAAAADESYLAQCRQQGMYPGGYYPHNVHFLWFASELEGRGKDSLNAARKISRYTIDLRCGAMEGPRQRYLPFLAMARFGRWEELLAEPEPAGEYGFDRAMAHYARGVAYSAKGRTNEASEQYAKFVVLEQDPAVRAMDNPYFPGTRILEIANQVLAGKLDLARGRTNQGIEHLREAVRLEEAMPYMEPPYWHYPVRLSLGAALLHAGRPAEAEAVFREQLKITPGSGWPLFGLEASLRAQGHRAAAREVRKQFDRAWKYSDTDLNLAWF